MSHWGKTMSHFDNFRLFCYLCAVMHILITFLAIFLAVAPHDAKREDSLRRVAMAEFFLADDKEGFLDACRDLIAYHESEGNEKQLFDAYATLFDRQEMWGMFDDAVETLNTMSAKAQFMQSRIGMAVTEFCFGQMYLRTMQPAEAEMHYRNAFSELNAMGEKGRALRAGFNLQAVAMNLGNNESGLAMNDSTELLLKDMETLAGKISPINKLKQLRYRFVLLLRLDRMREAAPLKDSLLHYAAILNDYSQDEIVLTAIAQFEHRRGNREEAYACLDTLIARNLQLNNFTKVSQFRLQLADFQRDNGELGLAVENYRLYAAESDSARIRHTNEQLNNLAKKYQLEELRIENRAARQRNALLSVILIGLLTGMVLILFFNRQLSRKNKALFLASQENIKAERSAVEALVSTPKKDLNPEERLFSNLLSLMKEEQLFKDSRLDRDLLCMRLGTNRTYLQDSVKKCSGETLNVIINKFRLRWAAKMLIDDSELQVAAIGEEAGFNSRSTFYRLFYEAYGMSPSEYRTAARH